MRIAITPKDKVLEQFGKRLAKLSEKEADRILARALNRGGDQARTQVRRSLVKQTGIKYGNIGKALATERAHPNRLSYSLIATGNETNIGLFNAKQRKKGVSATPWGKRRIFPGTFLVGAYGGNVYKRKGKERGPLEPIWGPNIAREVTRDYARAEWYKVEGYVMKRVDHELSRLFV